MSFSTWLGSSSPKAAFEVVYPFPLGLKRQICRDIKKTIKNIHFYFICGGIMFIKLKKSVK